MTSKLSWSLITVLLALALAATAGCSREQIETETATDSELGGLQMALVT